MPAVGTWHDSQQWKRISSAKEEKDAFLAFQCLSLGFREFASTFLLKKIISSPTPRQLHWSGSFWWHFKSVFALERDGMKDGALISNLNYVQLQNLRTRDKSDVKDNLMGAYTFLNNVYFHNTAIALANYLLANTEFPILFPILLRRSNLLSCIRVFLKYIYFPSWKKVREIHFFPLLLRTCTSHQALFVSVLSTDNSLTSTAAWEAVAITWWDLTHLFPWELAEGGC